jgi:ABC-type sugar transport system substrate-binding protein
MKKTRLGIALSLVLLAAAGAAAAFAAGTPVWTPADVAKVAKANGVPPFTPIYAVPKKIPHYKLAFINPDLSNPFFKTWEQGMKAAAKFYGVSFIEADAQTKYDTETDLYDQLNQQHPDAVGAHPGNAVIAQKALANHQPFITIDGYGGGNLGRRIGVPDVKVGQLAAKLVVDATLPKLKGTWKGKQVYFIGLGVPGCTPCEVRPHTAFDVSKKSISYAGSAFITQYATPDVGQKFMTDQMTAHPGGVFVIVPLNDESMIGVLQALKGAGKLDSAVAVTLGGDPAGRGFLRTYPKTVVAAIDFNPFAEAWDWVAASIASLQHKRYSEYPLSTVLTPENVNTLYPNDSK